MSEANQTNESKYNFDEMFFSHTDKKGIIQFANSVFCRVSEMELDELVGKPHRIVRHSEMPRAVFQMLWDYLKAEKPIVAYVKNRSKFGKYYWVIALAFPVEDGYISIRFKPSSGTFQAIQELYRNILEFEKTNSVEKSVELMEKEIVKMGFSNYQEFMVQALMDEMIAKSDFLQRDKTRKKMVRSLVKKHSAVRESEIIYKSNKDMEEASQFFRNEFDRIKLFCINLHAVIEQCGESARALSVTANTIASWGKRISEVLDEFLENQKSFQSACVEMRKSIAFAAVQEEMAQLFKTSKVDQNDKYEEILDTLAEKNNKKVSKASRELVLDFDEFIGSIDFLKKSMMALRIIRISTNIESAHIGQTDNNIASLVENIDEFILSLEEKLKWIQEKSDQVDHSVHKIAA